MHLGTALRFYSSIELPQHAVKVWVSEVDNAMADRVGGLLAHYTERHRADRSTSVSGDEVERLTKVDDEVAFQNRHVLKLAAHLDLQTRCAGIEDGDKSVIGMRPQPSVRGPSVVVHKIEKRITAS